MLRCVAVCCAFIRETVHSQVTMLVLQYVTVCFRVLQCVAVWCGAMRIHTWHGAITCGVARVVLRCVALRCNVLLCVAVCRAFRCDTVHSFSRDVAHS